MNVDIFIPCVIDQFYPNIGFNMIQLLEKNGCNVHYNPKQTCCGRVAFELGNWKGAKKIGENFISLYSGQFPIIFPSSTCLSFIQQNFKVLFHNTAYHIEYQHLLTMIYEFSDFVYHQLQVSDFKVSFPYSVLLIDDIEKNDSILQLLSKVKDLKLIIPTEKSDFKIGRDISMTNETIANTIVKHIILKALETKAEFITSRSIEDLHYINQYILKEKLDIKVIHYINILSSNF